MRCVLVPDTGAQIALHVSEDGTCAWITSPCPHCGDAPCSVVGGGRSISDCDRYYLAAGRCLDCGGSLGEIRVYMETLFGLEEDEAVLHGRARVYDGRDRDLRLSRGVTGRTRRRRDDEERRGG
jgi:hypothetical protein